MNINGFNFYFHGGILIFFSFIHTFILDAILPDCLSAAICNKGNYGFIEEKILPLLSYHQQAHNKIRKMSFVVTSLNLLLGTKYKGECLTLKIYSAKKLM